MKMIEHYCACPGCGECTVAYRYRVHGPKVKQALADLQVVARQLRTINDPLALRTTNAVAVIEDAYLVPVAEKE